MNLDLGWALNAVWGPTRVVKLYDIGSVILIAGPALLLKYRDVRFTEETLSKFWQISRKTWYRPILKFLCNRIVSCRVSLVNPSILLFLESSCIYLIILLYEHEFKINIIIILDNSGTRVVAIGAAEDVSPNTLNLWVNFMECVLGISYRYK